jgi:WD40 repeat protein
MFSGVLLGILRDGSRDLPERLSLAQVGELARQLIRERFDDEAVRPEVHSPDQSKGNLAEFPLFPNRSLHLVIPPPPPPANQRSRRMLASVAGATFLTLLVIGLGWGSWLLLVSPPSPPTVKYLPDAPKQKNLPDESEETKPKKENVVPVVSAPDKDPKVEELATIRWKGSKLTCMALAPDGQTVALGGESDTAELWDVRTKTRLASFSGHPGHIFSLALDPDGKRLAVGSRKQIWLWDVSASKRLNILDGHTGNVTGCWFCRDGKALVTVSENEAMVSGLTPGQKPVTIQGGNWELFPDGKTLGRCSFAMQSSTLELCDVFSPQQPVRIDLGITPFLGPPMIAAGSADGRRVAFAQGETVRVWDAVTSKDLGSHPFHTKTINSVDIAADGKTVASGGDDRTAILYEVDTKTRTRLEGHKRPIVRVRFSPCGKTLATGSNEDACLILWDVATGKQRKALTGNLAGMEDFQFSSNGRTLAVMCRDGGDMRVILWDVAPVTTTAK